MPMYKTMALAAITATLAACATVPQPLQGTYTNLTTVQAQQGGAGGTKVRWGGSIIKTEPGPQETCFYLMSRPLDSEARPEASSQAEGQGRFVACRAGFYDPEVFSRGREMTITGTLHGTISQKVGEYDYAYPRVEADVVYLWPKRMPVAAYPYYGPGFYDPFWGPGWGPYWGPWGGGFYGGGYYRSRVIVPRPAPAPHR